MSLYDKKITQLNSLIATDLTINDLIEIVDVSEPVDTLRNKQTALGELLTYIQSTIAINPRRVVLTPAPATGVLSFTLPVAATSFSDDKFYLYRNGILQNPGLGADYVAVLACAGTCVNVTLTTITGASEVFQLIYWI